MRRPVLAVYLPIKGVGALSGFLLLGLFPNPTEADISIDKLTGEGYSDIGQLVKGNDGGRKVDGQYLSRLGATITASDTVQGKLRITVGVGGIFWQSFPKGDFWQNHIQFGPGVTEASAKFLFSPDLSLEGGYFPFKYNASAMNLGEYLLRTESYPTYIATGGWTWVDSAYTRTLGFRLRASHLGGSFRHEVGIYFEYQNPPLYDISPAYLFTWQPVKGIEIGGGAALKRWINPNTGYHGTATSDRGIPAGQYVEIANFPEVQNQAMVHYSYDDGTGNRVAADTFAVWRGGTTLDQSALLAGKTGAAVQSISMIQDGSLAGMRKGIKKFLMNTKYSDGSNCWDGLTPCPTYFDAQGNLVADTDGVPGTPVAPIIVKEQDITRRAVNLMGRMDFNFAEMFGMEGAGPFKLYAEWAVLGTQNQPVYYQNVFQRMPIMVGLHVPTFGFLDLLAVESEYLDNPYRDSQMELAAQNPMPLIGPSMPIPDLAPNDYTLPKFTVPSVHGDDWKWSIHAVRTVLPGVKLKVQVANDHLRLQNFDAGGILPAASPQTAQTSQWYFVAHLQWGF